MGSSAALQLPKSAPPTFAKPSPGLRSVRQGSTQRRSFSIEKEWTASASPTMWDVKCDKLELVPAGFPLERTHREIEQDVSIVSTRISAALRKLSIEAEYNNEAAKAKCKTTDCVKFRIRLFSGGESGQPVIVELQRRNGSTSSFLSTCRAVLDAAEGRDPCAAKKKTNPFASKLPCQMKCLQAANLEPVDVKESLESAFDMVRSDRRDCKELGLENLCCIVDPVKSAPSTAVEASKLLLTTQELREDLRLLTERDVFGPEEEELPNHVDRLRHMSLVCFAKAFVTCSQESFLKAVAAESWSADYLLPSLLGELERAETAASNAYHAACCLQVLLKSSQVVCNKVTASSGVAVIEQAKAIGENSFELLEIEARRCLQVVGVSS